MSKSGGEQLAGCLPVIWSLCITTPMWLVLCFAILDAIEVPTWAWVLYWCYCPAVVLGVLLMCVVKAVTDD